MRRSGATRAPQHTLRRRIHRKRSTLESSHSSGPWLQSQAKHLADRTNDQFVTCIAFLQESAPQLAELRHILPIT